MIVLIISIFMSPLLGRKYLYNISYAQAFLILIFWTSGVDQNIKVFASWFQFSKFDFGYLFYSGFNSIFRCTIDSTKMTNLQFGCQSTVLNYFWDLVFFAFVIIIYKILNAFKHKLELINLLVNFINNKFPSSLIMWIFIHLFYQLELINIIALDLMMMKSHPLASGVSLIIAIWIIVYFCIKHKLFSKSLLESIDAENGLSFTLLSLIKYSFASSLFVGEDYVTQVVCAILYLWWCLIILQIQIKTDQTSLKIKALQRFSKIIKTSFNLMLSVIVFFYKLFMAGADQRLLVLIATWSFVLWLITELMSDITEIVASKFFK